jgi:hypothetical protein
VTSRPTCGRTCKTYIDLVQGQVQLLIDLWESVAGNLLDLGQVLVRVNGTTLYSFVSLLPRTLYRNWQSCLRRWWNQKYPS